MGQPLLTIGMATFDDFHGVYFTIQSLRIHHAYTMNKIEILVVDNNPSDVEKSHSWLVKKLINNINANNPKFKARYIPYKDAIGAANSKDRVFKEATGKFVMCIDCHVMFQSGTIAAILNYLEENPNQTAMMHGTLIYDDLKSMSTHFNYQWRGEMLGTWGNAWVDKNGVKFSCVSENTPEGVGAHNGGKWSGVLLSDGRTPFIPYGVNPNFNWAGHERVLIAAGCKMIGRDMNDEPFDIPGQGMGAVICAKEYWPGFNGDCRGFGGEELYIHKKHIANGHRVILLPFFRWLHRFGRPDGAKYPLTIWNKIRNYVLEFQEMGWDIQEVYNHFVVERKKLGIEEWEYLLADPKGHVQRPKAEQIEHKLDTVEKVFNRAKLENPSATNQLDIIRKYADMSDSAIDLSVERHTLVGILSSKCNNVTTYNGSLNNPTVQKLLSLPEIQVKHCEINPIYTLSYDQLKPADLVSIDITPEGSVLVQVLNDLMCANVIKRFIIINNTAIYGEFSPVRNAGLMPAIRGFLNKYPEFTVVEHEPSGNGITILSRDDRDKTPLPRMTEAVGNFFTAAKDFIASGGEKVSKEVYEARLAACLMCKHRNDKQCGLCRCYVEWKAGNAAHVCPIGKWAEAERQLCSKQPTV